MKDPIFCIPHSLVVFKDSNETNDTQLRDVKTNHFTIDVRTTEISTSVVMHLFDAIFLNSTKKVIRDTRY